MLWKVTSISKAGFAFDFYFLQNHFHLFLTLDMFLLIFTCELATLGSMWNVYQMFYIFTYTGNFNACGLIPI